MPKAVVQKHQDHLILQCIPFFDAFARLTYFELMAIYFAQSDYPTQYKDP